MIGAEGRPGGVESALRNPRGWCCRPFGLVSAALLAISLCALTSCADVPDRPADRAGLTTPTTLASTGATEDRDTAEDPDATVAAPATIEPSLARAIAARNPTPPPTGAMAERRPAPPAVGDAPAPATPLSPTEAPTGAAPTPAPTPVPASATPEAATPTPADRPTATSTPAVAAPPAAPPPPAQAPRWTFSEQSVFETHQVVSFYGHIRSLGELGLHTPEEAVRRIKALARQYDQLNGERGVVGAMHLIVDVAQGHPTGNGLYILRMEAEDIAFYVELAREHGLLLFLDVQIGWWDPFSAAQRLEPFLREPFVHLAVDPEFATRHRGAAPGTVLGSLTADQLNAVQDYLATLVRGRKIPPKLLVVHQFATRMLVEPERLRDVSEVEVVIDMDGFGGIAEKLGGYRRFALADYAERSAIKLFYWWDTPLMTPEQIAALDHPPDYVIYQ